MRKKINRQYFENCNPYFLLILFSILLFFLVCKDISHLYGITSRDEMGYWCAAAYMAGYDWKDITSQFAYYSYGTGILISILFKLFSNPLIIYRSAIVINGLLLVASLWLSYSCGKKLFPQIDQRILALFCMVTIIYPSNIVYSKYILSESYILLLVWAMLFCMIKIYESPNIFNCIILAILNIYCFAVHQRTIGIICASLICLVLMKIKKRIRWKHIFVYIAVFLLSLIAMLIIKEIYKSDMYGSSTQGAANDFAGYLKIFSEDKNNQVLYFMLKSFIGKVFYLGISTFCLIYAGVGNLTKKAFLYVKTIFKTNSTKEEYLEILAFIYLTFLSGLFINVITCRYPARIDHLVFGRYVEALIGPILLYSFILLYKSSKKYIYFLPLVIILLLCSVNVENFSLKISGYTTTFLSASSVAFSPLIENNEYYYGIFSKATLICILVIVLLVTIDFIKCPKYRFLKSLIPFLVVAVLFIYQEETETQNTTLTNQKVIAEDVFPMKEYIEDIEEIKEIYCISHEYIGFIQFQCPEISFKITSVEGLTTTNMGRNTYVLGAKEHLTNLDVNYQKVYETNKLVLYKKFR